MQLYRKLQYSFFKKQKIGTCINVAFMQVPIIWMELLTRFELVTSSLPRKCSAYWAITAKWRPRTGSNRRPLAWQASVLTNWTTGPFGITVLGYETVFCFRDLIIIHKILLVVNPYRKKFYRIRHCFSSCKFESRQRRKQRSSAENFL